MTVPVGQVSEHPAVVGDRHRGQLLQPGVVKPGPRWVQRPGVFWRARCGHRLILAVVAVRSRVVGAVDQLDPGLGNAWVPTRVTAMTRPRVTSRYGSPSSSRKVSHSSSSILSIGLPAASV